MSLKDYKLWRGQQLTVGSLVVQVPTERPKTDAEIVDREMLIEQIEEAAGDARETVKLARDLKAGLRMDIAATANRRRRGIPEEAGLFDDAKPAAPKKTKADGIDAQFREADGSAAKKRRPRKAGAR